jgi:hypothetical protein
VRSGALGSVIRGVARCYGLVLTYKRRTVLKNSMFVVRSEA